MLAGEPSGTEVIADSAYGSGKVRAQLKKSGHTVSLYKCLCEVGSLIALAGESAGRRGD